MHLRTQGSGSLFKFNNKPKDPPISSAVLPSPEHAHRTHHITINAEPSLSIIGIAVGHQLFFPLCFI